MIANIERMQGIPWRIIGWGTAALILLLPLVAMQFTEEVNWTASDFLFMGVLVSSIGVAFEFAVRKSRNLAYRAAAALALGAGFLLIWVNVAVGIIGSETGAANLFYGAVLLIAFLGAVLAWFRPRGMAWAMAAAALAQLLVPLIASLSGLSEASQVRAPEVVFATGFFTALWLLSALLFRQAAD